MTVRRYTTFRRGVAAAAVVVLAGQGITAVTAAGSTACKRVTRRGAFTVVATPAFDESSDPNGVGPTSHTIAGPRLIVGAGGPDRLFVTNGLSLVRSTDGGCTWQTAYTVNPTAAPAAGDLPRVVAQTDVEYILRGLAARLTAPGTAGPDPVFAVLPNSGVSGAVVGAATYGATNLQPFLVAHSADGGVTWRTDVLQATHPGLPAPRYELGAGVRPAMVVVSPADPRTAYLLTGTQCLEPGDAPTDVLRYGCLYVTRDAGATWAFVATNVVPGYREPGSSPLIVPDPIDPGLVYALQSESPTVHAISIGANDTVGRRHALAALPTSLTAQGLDVVHPAGGLPQLVVTESSPMASNVGSYSYEIYRSVNGGASWEGIGFPPGGTGVGFASDAAWLTSNGDIIGVRTVDKVTRVERWDARRRAWQTPDVIPPPLTGAESLKAVSFQPADTTHRRFVFTGTQGAASGTATVLGLYDSAAR